MILQATEQYEESSQNNNILTPHSTLCMTFDGDKQPLVKSLKFESELKFKCHLNTIFETSVLDKNLEDLFFAVVSDNKKINSKGYCSKKNKDDDDDFLEPTSEDESDKSLPDGVIKFSSITVNGRRG
jgi:hypothetical protein